MTTMPMSRIPRPGAVRRRGRSSAALGALAALLIGGAASVAGAAPAVAAPAGESTGYGHNYDEGKQDQPSLTVTPAEGLVADEPSNVTLIGKNYATTSDGGSTFGGAYTLFGAMELREADDPGSWAPSKRGVSGVHYDYMGEAGVYQLMVNYPGNTTEPGMPYMDANGEWTLENHPIPGARFTSQAGNEIDCLAEGTQCGFMTIGAHGQRSAGVEVFTPVHFEGDGTNPGEQPGGDDPCEPIEAPEGADLSVAGDPLLETDAFMTVTPGRYLPCDDVTEVIVEGSGYESTKPVYVGFGSQTNHKDPEQWRRSNEGLSGPGGDYDYGVPRLVVANGSSDGDVADSEMDANGDWSLTVEIPGKDVDSFFGGTIDCAVAYCGFFSFGAHGNIVAENEAYTPVYFGAQSPDDTLPGQGPGGDPPGDDGDPTQVPPSANLGGTPPLGGLGGVPGADGNGGLQVNGGLVATAAETGDGARTAVIGGLLLVSAGLLGAALLRNRRLFGHRID